MTGLYVVVTSIVLKLTFNINGLGTLTIVH